MSTARSYRPHGRSLFAIWLILSAVALASSATATAASAGHHEGAPAASRPPQALMRAAALTRQAERNVVSDTNKVERCQLAEQTHRGRCAAARHALQRAGSALARAEQRLARMAKDGRTDNAKSAAFDSSPGAPPALTVSGQTLQWNHNRNIEAYVLVRIVPRQGFQYSIVHGTAFTPPPVPGATVRYRIRTAVSWSLWSTEQSITYAPVGSPVPSGAKEPTPPGAPEPTPPAPKPSPPSDPKAAPHITVSGHTLNWNATTGVSSYVFVTKVPGQPDRYSSVTGTTTTPPAVPGQTVRYSARTNVEGSAWAQEVWITYPLHEGEVLNVLAAPHIVVSGQTLSWNATTGVSDYVFVTKVPGRPDQYSEVTGTTTTPPAVPGQTVRYSARTNIEGSAWAQEVTVSYPAPEEAKEERKEEHEAPNEPKEEHEAPNEEPHEGSSATFQPGINSGSAAIWELPGAALLGAKVVRVDVSIGESVHEFEPVIEAYAEKGIRVAPLADFYGTLPTAAQDQNLAAWASAFGAGGSFWSTHTGGQYAIQSIEFGNETSFSYQYSDNSQSGYATRAQTYALRFAEAARAIKATNPKVGLLAQGDPGNAGSLWIENMFKAVPELGQLVAGWTVHPYGPNWRAKFEAVVSQTVAQGAPSTIPIDVTEWGLSTDNGRCLSENFGWNQCMTYQEAAEDLTRTISEMRQALLGRLGLVLLYQIRDQRPASESNNNSLEYYFGAVQHELQAKGAYTTAVEAFLASS